MHAVMATCWENKRTERLLMGVLMYVGTLFAGSFDYYLDLSFIIGSIVVHSHFVLELLLVPNCLPT